MHGVSPVMLLENDPPPVPLLVFVASPVVGPGEVLQQTPRTVTPVIQSPVIVPPEFADVEVNPDMPVVVIDGVTVPVVNISSEPYDVPVEFVAYALT